MFRDCRLHLIFPTTFLEIAVRPSPLFFPFSVECVSWCWVGRSDWKRKKPKKNHKKSRNRRPWYPRMTLKVNIHIFGLTKCTIYCKKMFLFSPMLLPRSFFRLNELYQVKNGLTTFFFFENAKNLGWSDDAKRRKKKENGLNTNRSTSVTRAYYQSLKLHYNWGKLAKKCIFLSSTNFSCIQVDCLPVI